MGNKKTTTTKNTKNSKGSKKGEAAVPEALPEVNEIAPTDACASTEADTGREPEPEPTPGVTTLHDVLAAFYTQLESSGKSAATVASYRTELQLAGKEIGLTLPIADLTEDRVRTFFEGDAVTKLKSGREKSQLSIDKTRRVFRQALVWAAERGIVAKAPLPEMVAAK